ncbi:MAG: helix-turn-helix domain-containing protein [Lentisphaeria bacterium]|jgi:transcriptional regulator with XRE-family HTH domain
MAWDGELTPEIRRRLREKRVQLGVTCQNVGALLKVDSSTVLKWEHGKVKRATITVRPRLEAFLRGEYDAIFAARLPALPAAFRVGEAGGQWPAGKGDFQALLERLGNVHALCQARPELRAELAEAVEALADRLLAKLVAAGPAEPQPPPELGG